MLFVVLLRLLLLVAAIGWLLFNNKCSCFELAVAMVVTTCHHCGRTLSLQRGSQWLLCLRLHGISAWDCCCGHCCHCCGCFKIFTHIALAMAIVIESFCHWAATLLLPLDLCSHACNSYPSWYAVVVASPIPRLIVLKICSLASLSPLAATVLQSVGVDSASTCFDAESYLVCCCHHGCCIY